jgi:hypothetical protein
LLGFSGMAVSKTRCLPKYVPTACSCVASAHTRRLKALSLATARACVLPTRVWFYALRGGIATSGDRTSADLAGRRLHGRRKAVRRIFLVGRWRDGGRPGRPIIRVTLPGRSTASTKHLSNASQQREHRDPFNPRDRRVPRRMGAQRHGHLGGRDTWRADCAADPGPRFSRIHSRSSPGGAFGPAPKKSPHEIRALTKRAAPCAGSWDLPAIGRRRADGARLCGFLPCARV